MKKIFLDKSRDIQEIINSYFGCIIKSALVFNEGVGDYFKGRREDLESRLSEITAIERDADEQLGKARYGIYAYMLIPDSRGDVLKLLDGMDDLVDAAKQVLLQISIEKPNVDECVKDDFIGLGEASCKAVEALVAGARAFFENDKNIDDYVNKVYFFEKEADKLEEKIKKKIFDSREVGLSNKMHIRDFAEKLALLSDKSEEVVKNLLIFSLKRRI